MFVSGVTDCATPTIAAATIDLVFHEWVGIATIRRVTIFLGELVQSFVYYNSKHRTHMDARCCMRGRCYMVEPHGHVPGILGRAIGKKFFLELLFDKIIQRTSNCRVPPSSQRQLSNAGTYMLLMRASRGRYDAVELWGSLLVVNW